MPSIVSNTKAVTIRGLWIDSLGLFSMAMSSTFLISSSLASAGVFCIVGFSGAASSWRPSALLGVESSSVLQLCEKYGGMAT